MKITFTLVDDEGKTFEGSAILAPVTNRKTKQSRAERSGEKESVAAKGLPAHILRLRGTSFFKQPKTAPEVHEKLKLSYHCDLNRVEVSLFKLVKRKQLRKASKIDGDKKRVAYVW